MGRPARDAPNERELEIVSWIAGGASLEQIAKELELTLPTVKSALAVLRKRYSAHTSAHLVSLMHIGGYLDTPCRKCDQADDDYAERYRDAEILGGDR